MLTAMSIATWTCHLMVGIMVGMYFLTAFGVGLWFLLYLVNRVKEELQQ